MGDPSDASSSGRESVDLAFADGGESVSDENAWR